MTELDAEPGVDLSNLSGLYLGCMSYADQNDERTCLVRTCLVRTSLVCNLSNKPVFLTGAT